MLMQTSRPQLQVSISGFSFPYRRWQPGDRPLGPALAMDTETALIVDHEIPPLAMATASDGRSHVLIHPDDVGAYSLIAIGKLSAITSRSIFG